MTNAQRIMIVTGEASGDLLGANLIRAVKNIAPATSFFGVGGRRMATAGCEVLIPGEALAVMGIVEVVARFPPIWCAFQRLKRELSGNQKPDALVLIDFPDFNLRLAKHAKKAGIPVLYYVSPQVWAWRRGRVKKIAEVVDTLAAIFPFEPDFYKGLDILVKYVGHPLLDEFTASAEGNLLQHLNVPTGMKIVGLFPGSRRNELHYMLETLVDAARLIRQYHPDVHFLVPIADTLLKDEVQAKFTKDLSVSFIVSQQASIYQVARCCETILTVSGTVTLQIALTGTPMAILYKMSPLTYAIGRCLVRIEHFGLPNIVADERIVPEFLQAQATPRALADEVLHVLNDAGYAESLRQGLGTMRTKLGEPGCSMRVAKMLFGLINRQGRTQGSDR
jgi:lipid-A-disaccharide synthase